VDGVEERPESGARQQVDHVLRGRGGDVRDKPGAEDREGERHGDEEPDVTPAGGAGAPPGHPGRDRGCSQTPDQTEGRHGCDGVQGDAAEGAEGCAQSGNRQQPGAGLGRFHSILLKRLRQCPAGACGSATGQRWATGAGPGQAGW
jgi:hypothetical protein